MIVAVALGPGPRGIQGRGSCVGGLGVGGLRGALPTDPPDDPPLPPEDDPTILRLVAVAFGGILLGVLLGVKVNVGVGGWRETMITIRVAVNVLVGVGVKVAGVGVRVIVGLGPLEGVKLGPRVGKLATVGTAA